MSRSAARADHGGSRAGCMPVAAALAGAAVALVVAGGIVAFLLLHTTGSPRATASAYLTAWQSRGYAEMDAVTVNAPEGGVARPLRAAAAQLGLRRIHLVLGQVTQADEPLGEERLHDREEEERVGAGPDEVVHVGVLGGPRPARIDDHDLAAARPDGA